MNAFTSGALRRRTARIGAAAALPVAALLVHPAIAGAEEPVTYEVVSAHIQVADIEYQDVAGRLWAVRAPLPWRMDAVVPAVQEAPPTGSQVRAHWRSVAVPGRWVTVRIIYRGKVLCQNTLDLGNATCYGITPRIT